jgi:hypothetical protein
MDRDLIGGVYDQPYHGEWKIYGREELIKCRYSFILIIYLLLKLITFIMLDELKEKLLIIERKEILCINNYIGLVQNCFVSKIMS